MTERTEAEYRMWMDMLCNAACIIATIPIDDLLATVERAETAAPLLDPGAYLDALSGLAGQRRLLKAAKPLRQAAHETLRIETLPTIPFTAATWEDAS